MKKLLYILHEKWDAFNLRLKSSLEALPSEARLNIVLILMALYLIVTIVFLARVIMERNEETWDMRHIKPVERIEVPDSIPLIEKNDTVSHLNQNK
ncbi:TraL conjugative transposon family protein [Proteiniphilum sp. UBA5346]|uniref:TraL conjugative transposon family protein n=1 Tax=Proteiniphilum sp. UBA5346 TaxID=1947277 RepID=UPI002579EACB|nr:TraL conjugative transposon family protein [Proteiniphilum sp. UBA5346]